MHVSFYASHERNSLLHSLFSFSRTIKGSDIKHDLDLNDDYYLLFGLGQTARGLYEIIHTWTQLFFLQYHFFSLISDSFTQGFIYHSTKTPVVSKNMMNPVTGAIAKVTTEAASSSWHEHSNTTTAAPAYTTMATTVTVGVVDEALQVDGTTEQPQNIICSIPLVCVCKKSVQNSARTVRNNFEQLSQVAKWTPDTCTTSCTITITLQSFSYSPS